MKLYEIIDFLYTLLFIGKLRNKQFNVNYINLLNMSSIEPKGEYNWLNMFISLVYGLKSSEQICNEEVY